MAILIDKSLDVPEYPIWRFTVEQYHKMIQSGILTEDDPVELLEGWPVIKMPQNPPHLTITQLASDVLSRRLPPGWFINVQGPISTADSEPEPDIVVVRGRRLDYMERLPSPSDIALVVEVSDATLQRDRTLKLRVYANAHITTYWILNLPERQIEVYTDPEQAAYRQRTIYRESDDVPVVIDGQEVGWISVRELLP